MCFWLGKRKREESHNLPSSTSNHNIRQLHFQTFVLYLIFLLHQTTTENNESALCPVLYLIFLLHQTTTSLRPSVCEFRCILSFFYIKPQPDTGYYQGLPCCILSFFYIKPQLEALERSGSRVVSYLSSTSNHNFSISTACGSSVVSYLSSTSNHNLSQLDTPVVLLYLIFLLHQTTT